MKASAGINALIFRVPQDALAVFHLLRKPKSSLPQCCKPQQISAAMTADSSSSRLKSSNYAELKHSRGLQLIPKRMQAAAAEGKGCNFPSKRFPERVSSPRKQAGVGNYF